MQTNLCFPVKLLTKIHSFKDTYKHILLDLKTYMGKTKLEKTQCRKVRLLLVSTRLLYKETKIRAAYTKHTLLIKGKNSKVNVPVNMGQLSKTLKNHQTINEL